MCEFLEEIQPDPKHGNDSDINPKSENFYYKYWQLTLSNKKVDFEWAKGKKQYYRGDCIFSVKTVLGKDDSRLKLSIKKALDKRELTEKDAAIIRDMASKYKVLYHTLANFMPLGWNQGNPSLNLRKGNWRTYRDFPDIWLKDIKIWYTDRDSLNQNTKQLFFANKEAYFDKFLSGSTDTMEDWKNYIDKNFLGDFVDKNYEVIELFYGVRRPRSGILQASQMMHFLCAAINIIYARAHRLERYKQYNLMFQSLIYPFCECGSNVINGKSEEMYMSVIIERVFNAVGQGGFYEERFYDQQKNFYNFVFDCGTENTQALYYDTLDQKHYDLVNLLCISHFDNDHVSLLPTFLKGKKVETLIMPQITNEIIYSIILNIGSAAPDDDLTVIRNQYALLSNPRGFIHSVDGMVERIIYILNGDNNKEVQYNESLTIEELSDGLMVPSGSELYSKKFADIKWIFKPINISFVKGSLRDDFIKKIQEIISNHKSYKDRHTTIDMDFLKEALSDKALIEIIRKSYHAIYKGNIHKKMNDYSMALYSGLASNSKPINGCIYVSRRCDCNYHYNCRDCDQHNTHNSYKVGCLYLGDYNAKSYYDILNNYYWRYKEKHIQTVQIPHHGSIKSWNTKLLEWAEDFVVSYGSNSHSHPSPDVLLHVLHKKRLFEVTHSCRSCLNYFIIMHP